MKSFDTKVLLYKFILFQISSIVIASDLAEEILSRWKHSGNNYCSSKCRWDCFVNINLGKQCINYTENIFVNFMITENFQKLSVDFVSFVGEDQLTFKDARVDWLTRYDTNIYLKFLVNLEILGKDAKITKEILLRENCQHVNRKLNEQLHKNKKVVWGKDVYSP